MHADMRMKMFAAETLEAAKAMIFAEMGEDAIILSEREVPGGVEVRAATDKLGGGMVPSEPRFIARMNRNGAPGRPQDNPLRNRVRDALIWHCAPERFAERVADAGMPMSSKTQDPAEIMASGLDALITCDPIPAMPHVAPWRSSSLHFLMPNVAVLVFVPVLLLSFLVHVAILAPVPSCTFLNGSLSRTQLGLGSSIQVQKPVGRRPDALILLQKRRHGTLRQQRIRRGQRLHPASANVL